MIRSNNQRGSIFLVLFSAVAIMGLLGVGLTSFIQGPMTSAVKMTRNNAAQAQMVLAAQSAVMGSSNLGVNGDCDSDGFIEPVEWRLASGSTPKPTGGNLLPSNIGAPTTDPWGSEYGYCVWDHGTTVLNAACQLDSPGNNRRLAGTNAKKYVSVAIVSAGPDKKFDTTCRTFAAADANSNGTLGDTGDFELVQKDTATNDDLIFTYTYEEATAASGGLWSLKSSGAATISRSIEAPQAKFTGTSMLTSIGSAPLASSETSVAMLSGLRLADSTQMAICNSANTGVIRRPLSGGVEMCNGTSWVVMGGGSGGSSTYLDDLSDVIVNYARGNMMIGTTSGSVAAANAGMGNTLMSGGGSMLVLTNAMGNTGFGASMNKLTSGSANTALGASTLTKIMSGTNNVAIGYNSLQGAGTGGRDVHEVTAIGYETLSTYTNNLAGTVVFGRSAGLGSNASSTGLTAYGAYAASNAVTGVGNSAIGFYSMDVLTTGSYNTGLGDGTLQSVTTGSRNTAVGSGASSTITVQSDTVSIGAGSLNVLKGATSSGNHVAVGLWSLGYTNGVIAQSNIGVGNSVMFNNTTGGGNIAIGSSALHDNTTTGSNTAIGNSASQSKREIGGTSFGSQANNSTGTAGYGSHFGYYAGLYNAPSAISFGSYSMSNNTGINSYSAAVGYEALRSQSTGSYNTAVGSSALVTVGTSQYNTGIGYLALQWATGASSTAVGYQAANGVTNAVSNIAIGYNAMRSVNTSASNTVIGYEALYSATSSAPSNTVVGNRALRSFGGAANNVAIGSNAAYNINGGADNVYAGSYAGYGGNSSATASTSVYVGSGAGYSITSASSGTGYGAEALYSASSGSNNSAFGAYAAAKIGGGSNTVAGYHALALSTGASNAAAGAGALGGSTSAASSDALGAMALGGASSSNFFSSAAGAYALFSLNATSAQNVALGYRAGYAVTNATNVVAIGALSNSSSNYTNSIGIGYNALPTAANTIRFGDTNVTLISGQVAWTAPSDKRLKKDITPTDLGLDFIMGLKPVKYRMINGNGRIDYGFLAQDIEAKLDGRVTNMITQLNDKMKTYQMRSNDLKAPIVKAIQEQQAKIERLKREIAALKNETVNCEEVE